MDPGIETPERVNAEGGHGSVAEALDGERGLRPGGRDPPECAFVNEMATAPLPGTCHRMLSPFPTRTTTTRTGITASSAIWRADAAGLRRRCDCCQQSELNQQICSRRSRSRRRAPHRGYQARSDSPRNNNQFEALWSAPAIRHGRLICEADRQNRRRHGAGADTA